eukprot:scaffold61887_cov63-Phaeocystis_antarctica.AAC.4
MCHLLGRVGGANFCNFGQNHKVRGCNQAHHVARHRHTHLLVCSLQSDTNKNVRRHRETTAEFPWRSIIAGLPELGSLDRTCQSTPTAHMKRDLSKCGRIL